MFNDEYIDKAKYLFEKLFPICRSITGKGIRDSFEILRELNPEFTTKNYPSGKKVFDWTIPKEWNVSDAYIKDSKGKRVVDFKENNVHLVSYSIPIKKDLGYDELLPHLHYLPNLPNAIPYRTSYYKENWGFCLTYEQFLNLDKNENALRL